MRRALWLGATFILFVATVGLTGWSDFRTLAHQRDWNVASADAAEGTLADVVVGVRGAHAAIVDSRPDRALLHVRLDLQGSPEAANSWVDCRASLRGADGETWLPLNDYSVRGAIKILAPDGRDNGDCNTGVVSETGPVTFDQIYRIPASALDDLTLHISGYGTRPSALAFEIEPTVRIFKSE